MYSNDIDIFGGFDSPHEICYGCEVLCIKVRRCSAVCPCPTQEIALSLAELEQEQEGAHMRALPRNEKHRRESAPASIASRNVYRVPQETYTGCLWNIKV